MAQRPVSGANKSGDAVDLRPSSVHLSASHLRRVAISQRVETVPSYGEVRDCLDQQWAVWLESLGLLAVPVPNQTSDVPAFCDAFDVSAIFLSGGNNFADHVYEDASVEVTDGSPERDRTERALVTHAIERRLPLIAWCRGMQVLQVYFGGRLCRTAESTVGHVATTHEIEIVSQAHRSLAGDTVDVNSYHDFGVRQEALAAPLLELAIVAADGTVEAVFHPDLPIVGCQWHPERPLGDGDGFNRALVRQLLFPES